MLGDVVHTCALVALSLPFRVSHTGFLPPYLPQVHMCVDCTRSCLLEALCVRTELLIILLNVQASSAQCPVAYLSALLCCSLLLNGWGAPAGWLQSMACSPQSAAFRRGACEVFCQPCAG